MNKAMLAVLGLGILVIIGIVLITKTPSQPLETASSTTPEATQEKKRAYISWDWSMEAVSPYGEEITIDPLPEVLKREDIVTVYEPHSGDPGVLLLRRIVGLPGETITLEGGVITITNSEHPEGLVLAELYSEGAVIQNGTWHLAADEYFVMADNRPSESDSSKFGPVKASALHGIYRP